MISLLQMDSGVHRIHRERGDPCGHDCVHHSLLVRWSLRLLLIEHGHHISHKPNLLVLCYFRFFILES